MNDTDVGTITIDIQRTEGHSNYPSRARITHADPTIRIPAVLITQLHLDGLTTPHLHLDGDHLTITDDYGRQLTYRIDWDNYSSGYYAELQ